MQASNRFRKTAPFMIIGGLLLIGVGAALPHIVDGLPDFFRTLVVALGFGEAALGTLIIIKHPNP
jgi:hypothetical protein